MSHLSTCYGPDIEALADLDGGFEGVTTTAIVEFAWRQWRDVAGTLGFLQALTRALGGRSTARGGLLGLQSVALAEFETWHSQRGARLASVVPADVRQRRASVRRDVLLGHVRTHAGNLWRVNELASELPHGACFERGPATSLSGRAFLDDSAGNYFHPTQQGFCCEGCKNGDKCESGAKTPCDWPGPVYLSLGTYPWVSGGRLGRTPPALAWDRAGDISPAIIAMRLCASQWQPEVNLRQDAREVVLAYRYFRAAAELALRGVPTYSPRTAIPGGLYRRDLLLHAEQSSVELHTLSSPLGPLAASAYNYIIRRFAAFFALRRSLLASVTQLTQQQQQAIEANPDPCIQTVLKAHVLELRL